MTEMTTARFAALLDAYGADPARWPAVERTAALALLHADAAAARAQARAAALDAVLDRAPVAPPSAALAARVLAAAPRRRSPAGSPAGPFGALLARLIPAPGTWQPAAAMAAALVLGLIVGYAAPPAGIDGSIDGQSLDVIALGTFAEMEEAL